MDSEVGEEKKKYLKSTILLGIWSCKFHYWRFSLSWLAVLQLNERIKTFYFLLLAFCWSLLCYFLSRIPQCSLVICKRTRRSVFSALCKSFEVWWKLSNPVRSQRVKTVLLQSCIITVFVVIDNTECLNFPAHFWKCRREETFL